MTISVSNFMKDGLTIREVQKYALLLAITEALDLQQYIGSEEFKLAKECGCDGTEYQINFIEQYYPFNYYK